jgi:hypothetical protein
MVQKDAIEMMSIQIFGEPGHFYFDFVVHARQSTAREL